MAVFQTDLSYSVEFAKQISSFETSRIHKYTEFDTYPVNQEVC